MDYQTPTRERVTVIEVGTRDGFQSEKDFIATPIKAEIVDALIGDGIRDL